MPGTPSGDLLGRLPLDHHLGNALSEATKHPPAAIHPPRLRLPLTGSAWSPWPPSPAAASAHPSPADHGNGPTETAIGPEESPCRNLERSIPRVGVTTTNLPVFITIPRAAALLGLSRTSAYRYAPTGAGDRAGVPVKVVIEQLGHARDPSVTKSVTTDSRSPLL